MSFHHRTGDSEVSGDFSILENLVKELSTDYHVDVGYLGEKSQTEEGGLTIAGIAAVHEFGTDKAGRGRSTVIPERSTIRMPLETGQESIEKEVGRNFQKRMEDGDIEGIFTDIGIACEGRIQDAFDTGGFGEWPDISESTKEQKGSEAILIDDGTMRKSVSSKVGKP